MVNKIILVILSILVGIFLIPIVIAGVDNAKLVDQTIEFSITSTSEVITTTLSESDIATIITYYDDVKSVSSITLDGDTLDIFDSFDIPDTIYYEETEVVETLSTIDNTPFYIRSGDYLVFDMDDEFYNDIAYTERFGNDSALDGATYGFQSDSQGYSYKYGGSSFILDGTEWNNHTLSADFNDSVIDWAVVGGIGTLTFLIDVPYEFVGIYRSSSGTDIQTAWANPSSFDKYATLYLTKPISELDLVFDTATLSLNVGDYSITSDTALKEGTQSVSMTFEIPMENATSTMLDILPIIFVLIIVVGSVAYIKFNK